MKCELMECTGDVWFHLTWVMRRVFKREQRLCDFHAREAIAAYTADLRMPHAGERDLLFEYGYDLELIVYCERRETSWLYLRRNDSNEHLVLLLGTVEAWNIVRMLTQSAEPRPLTHTAMATVIKALGGRLREVVIDDLKEYYYAKVRIEQLGNTVSVDVRPSDAIGLAIVAHVPIVVTEKVLREAASRNSTRP